MTTGVQSCRHQEVFYQWDPEKAQANLAKHSVDSADAVGVFEVPYAKARDDPDPDEQRFLTLGMDLLGRVLVVCWTSRDDDIRLISARPANKRERAQYQVKG